MARQPFGGRPNKAALNRMKVTTGIVSVVTFLGSLGAIATLSPGTHAALSTSAQTAQVGSSTLSQSNTLSQFSTRRQAFVTPLTRTRGS
jgi:hypothetical protein